jgi:hypothetical protein
MNEPHVLEAPTPLLKCPKSVRYPILYTMRHAWGKSPGQPFFTHFRVGGRSILEDSDSWRSGHNIMLVEAKGGYTTCSTEFHSE